MMMTMIMMNNSSCILCRATVSRMHTITYLEAYVNNNKKKNVEENKPHVIGDWWICRCDVESNLWKRT